MAVSTMRLEIKSKYIFIHLHYSILFSLFITIKQTVLITYIISLYLISEKDRIDWYSQKKSFIKYK